MNIGFDSEKYLEEQSKYILERINGHACERLYLEFGGKLVHDKHAARVLPGFDENAKIKLLARMKDHAEIIIPIYAGDIIANKTRADYGITYDLEVMRLIDTFRKYELPINSVVITRYEDSPSVNQFITKLERRGIRTYKHYYTKGYPTDVDTIVSEGISRSRSPLSWSTAPAPAPASWRPACRSCITNRSAACRPGTPNSRRSRSGTCR